MEVSSDDSSCSTMDGEELAPEGAGSFLLSLSEQGDKECFRRLCAGYVEYCVAIIFWIWYD